MGDNKGLKIYASHLALRFYKHLGWTLDLLNPYLIRGQFKDQVPGQEVRDYYWLDHEQGSAIDSERFYKELEPRVFHWDKDRELFGDEAVAFLKEMNW